MSGLLGVMDAGGGRPFESSGHTSRARRVPVYRSLELVGRWYTSRVPLALSAFRESHSRRVNWKETALMVVCESAFSRPVPNSAGATGSGVLRSERSVTGGRRLAEGPLASTLERSGPEL